MGKCVGKVKRVEHYDPKHADVYDKFGNLVSSVANNVEVFYNGRKLMFSSVIQVSLKSSS